MYFISYASSLDPNLGKVDKASLSQEVLMELFIADIENKNRIVGDPKDPSPAIQWKGVTLNSSEEIISVDWGWLYLRGKICWEWMPVTVSRLCLNKNELRGTINLTVLPDGFESFEISSNLFSGSISLNELPLTIRTLMLYNNRLSGSVNLESLPSEMKVIVLKWNRFVGKVCLTNLPQDLRVLDIAENKFSGAVNLTCLPSQMTKVVLHSNDFSEETDFSQLPETLTFIDVSFTHLTGEIWMTKKLFCKCDDTEVVVKKTRARKCFMIFIVFLIAPKG